MIAYAFLSNAFKTFVKLGMHWILNQVSMNFGRFIVKQGRIKLKNNYREMSEKHPNIW